MDAEADSDGSLVGSEPEYGSNPAPQSEVSTLCPQISTSSMTISKLHEEILRVSLEKNGRSFLENPEWGVGVTTTRGKPLLPNWCQFCSSGDYTCLGKVCMGSKPSALSVHVSHHGQSSSIGTKIPGLDFKNHSSLDARNPGMKKVRPIMKTAHEKKVRTFSGVCRNRKIPFAAFPPCYGSKRRVKPKVHLTLLFHCDIQLLFSET